MSIFMSQRRNFALNIFELGASNEELSASYEELSSSQEEIRDQYHRLAIIGEDLRQTKEFLENLITNANVPIIVWDPSFRIVKLNHAFEFLIGKTSEEVVGTSLEFLFPPDKADKYMQLVQTTQNGVRWKTVEMDIIHQDGSLRELLWNSSTLYSPDGITPVATMPRAMI